ncbi:O-antigen ligase family protein [Wukongibacter baidiensis]|uniref:O-antigen ligase family protein n=1 Tax=Wukongibacter baidiensis TaxID=1723361 RepID=UPI003D7F21E7
MYLVFVLSIIINFSYYTVKKFGIPIIPFTTLLATIPLAKKLMVNISRKENIIDHRIRNILFLIITFSIVYTSIGSINTYVPILKSYPYHLLTGLTILLYLTLFIDNDYKLNKILEVIVLGGIILGVTNIVDAYKSIHLTGFRTRGWIGASNEAAFIMNLCIFTTIYLEKRFHYSRKKLFLIRIFYCISILLTLSRGGITLAIILLISNIKFSKKQIIFYLLTLIIAIQAFYLISNIPIFSRLNFDRLFMKESSSIVEYSNGRLPALLASIRIFLENPIVGVGIGNSLLESDKYLNGFTYVRAHNTWGLVLSETGFIPFTILVTTFITILSTIKSSICIEYRKIYRLFIYILIFQTFLSHNVLFYRQTWLFLGIVLSDINMINKNSSITTTV